MTAITQAELDLLREQQLEYLDLPVTIKRESFVIDGEEGGYTPIYEDIMCSIKQGYGFYRSVADKFMVTNPHIISFAWNQDIKVKDQIYSQTTDAVWHIRDIPDDISYMTLKKVLADRLV